MLGLGKGKDALALAAFSEKLPDGLYRLGEVPDFCGGANAALAWLLGTYQLRPLQESRKKRSLSWCCPRAWTAKRSRASPKMCSWRAT